jgi:hypothetical protein
MNADKISAIPKGVTLTTLDNGLTIIVREDHSAPVVSAQAWCATGIGCARKSSWNAAGNCTGFGQPTGLSTPFKPRKNCSTP